MSMPTRVALLRGVNVGGKSLKMEALRAALTSAGLTNVRTYIQSGNLAFEAEGGEDGLARSIAETIETAFDLQVHVQVFGADLLDAAAATNPYAAEALAEPKSVHVFFLERAPPAPQLEQIEALRAPTERWALEGRLFFLHAPAGIGVSKLAEKVERLLGVKTTARNCRTVEKLRELATPRGPAGTAEGDPRV